MARVPDETIVYQHLQNVVVINGRKNLLTSYWALNPGVSPGARTPKISSSGILAWKLNKIKRYKCLMCYSFLHLIIKNLPHSHQLVHPGRCVLFVQARIEKFAGLWTFFNFFFTCYRRLYCSQPSRGHNAWTELIWFLFQSCSAMLAKSLFMSRIFFWSVYLRASTFS